MKKEIDQSIADNVKSLRLRLSVSQRDLAIVIGTSHNFITQVENRNSPCKYSARHLYLIAKEYDCKIADLFPPIDPLAP